MTGLLLQVCLGLLLADFISGVVHWIEDRYGNPNLPLLGPVFAANELHHTDPMDFTKGSFLQRNISTFTVVGFVSAIAYLIFGASIWLTVATIIGAFSNEIHVWSHTRPKNRLIVMFQRMGLLQPPAQHARHHREPFLVCYCVVTGFLNPILDEIRFWSLLERLVPLKPKD